MVNTQFAEKIFVIVAVIVWLATGKVVRSMAAHVVKTIRMNFGGIMTTLKQLLCAIINFGHPYKTEYHKGDGKGAYKKQCSCGKIFESKAGR